MTLSVNAQVGYRGTEIHSFTITSPEEISDLSLSVQRKDFSQSWPVEATERNAERLSVPITPFPADWGFTLSGLTQGKRFLLTQKDVVTSTIRNLDLFAAKQEGDVLYRLYTPKSKGPRPLLLFLHGGGECGYDNVKQLTNIFGALKLADDYPDCYILAPQAPGVFEDMLPDPAIVYRNTFHSVYQPAGTGWHREYLTGICDIIRRMTAEGQVDADRVYVTGMSMGGAGTLRMLSVGSGLFAAAAPVCPTMTPETFGILSSLTDMKIWVSTAYADHTLYRHKYIVDAILKLKEQGNRNAHLTLYAPEELEKYGFSDNPTLSLTEKLAENHYSWVLTYHNEYGIMDWLMSQHK